jgi:serine protease Do
MPGDLIIQWNGKPIAGPSELAMAVAWTKIGQIGAVTILRAGSRQTLTVKVGELPKQVP